MKPTLEKLRAIYARQQTLHEQEKALLAHRMHNQLSQKATVLALELSLLDMEMDKNKSKASWKLKIKELSALTNDLSRSIREITNQLRPKILDEFGLIAALQWYAKSIEKEIRCSVIHPEQDIVLQPSVSSGLFGLTETIITRIFRPLSITRMDIIVVHKKDRIQLRLSAEHKSRQNRALSPEVALDWLAIEERALSLGATVKLEAVPQIGTIVICSFLLKPVSESTRRPVSTTYASNSYYR